MSLTMRLTSVPLTMQALPLGIPLPLGITHFSPLGNSLFMSHPLERSPVPFLSVPNEAGISALLAVSVSVMGIH